MAPFLSLTADWITRILFAHPFRAASVELIRVAIGEGSTAIAFPPKWVAARLNPAAGPQPT